ncbi:hypothetical protein JCM9957A_12020 [Kineosporia succinea]
MCRCFTIAYSAGMTTSLMARAGRMEAGGWVSLYRWIFRRPRTSAGATAFAYTMPTVALYWAFIGVSAAETIGVDFLLHRWPVARVILLVLGLWGVIFMLGMLASMKVNPHEAGPDGLVVRNGVMFSARLGWADMAGISLQVTNLDTSKTFQMLGGVLHVAVTSQTNLHVELREPVVVSLPDRDEEITSLRFWADDPQALLALARQYRKDPVR